MENDILFREKQHFGQWWLWLLLLGFNGLFLYAVFYQVIGGKPFGEKPMNDSELLAGLAISLFGALFFVIVHLDTLIKKEGVYVRMFPFHIKYKFYPWDSIAKAYIYRYQPIAEFGGWGIRFSMSGKGRALNVAGDMGLQLEFTDGSALLIGTQKPEEIGRVLVQLGRDTESR